MDKASLRRVGQAARGASSKRQKIGNDESLRLASGVRSMRDEGEPARAISHLKGVDARLKLLCEKHSYSPPGAVPCYFGALAKTIIFQQLHGTAAASIHAKFLDALKSRVNPDSVLATSDANLRSCGLSERKVAYLKSLADKFKGGLDDAKLEAMSDEDLEETLLSVKGLGPWSVDMFKLFSLGRSDVLPTGDFGIRKGMMLTYDLKSLPKPSVMKDIASDWKPYSSVGSWLMYRVADEAPASKAKKGKKGKTAAKKDVCVTKKDEKNEKEIKNEKKVKQKKSC